MMKRTPPEAVSEIEDKHLPWWIKTTYLEKDFRLVDSSPNLTNQEKLCIAEGLIIKALVEEDLLPAFEWAMHFEGAFYKAVQSLREKGQDDLFVTEIFQYADTNLYNGTIPKGLLDWHEDPLAKKLSVGAGTLFRFVQEIVAETDIPQSQLINASMGALVEIAQGGLKNNPVLKAPQVCPHSGKLYYDKAWFRTFLKLHTEFGWKLSMGGGVKPRSEIEDEAGCPALWAGVFAELVEKVFLTQPREGEKGEWYIE